MKKLDCLRCGERLGFVGRQKFQLGQTGWLLGDLPNLVAGSLELDIYFCPVCSKVEFYLPDEQQPYSQTGLPQVRCPACGAAHDFDYPKCPHCGHEYPLNK